MKFNIKTFQLPIWVKDIKDRNSKYLKILVNK